MVIKKSEDIAKEEKKEEVLFAYPALTWKSSGSLATLSSDETDNEGDLVSRVLQKHLMKCGKLLSLIQLDEAKRYREYLRSKYQKLL